MAPWRGRLGAPTGRTGPASGRHARERETSTDDAAPGQRECRGIFCRDWCADGPIMRVSRGGTRHNNPRVTGGSLPSAFRNAGTWPALRQTVSATPLDGSHRTRRFPPGRRHLGTESPSRRPPSAGCAGRRPAFQAVPALQLSRRYAVPPAFGGLWRPEAGVPSRPRASTQSAIRSSPRLRRAVPAGGRRSKPSSRFNSVGDTQFPPPSAGCAGRRPAFQAVLALQLSRRYAVPPAFGGLCRPEAGPVLPVGTRRPADKAREGGIPRVFRPKRNDERRGDGSPAERRVGSTTDC